MLKPSIYRTSAGSSGEQLIEMIASRLKRISFNKRILQNGNEITIVSSEDAIPIGEYFYPKQGEEEVKQLIRTL